MPAAERRHLPRTKLEKIAYIHIEPNNGGIIRDVSDEGLGFHSTSPVEKNGGVRFSLQEQNRRIEVSGELTWSDEENKIGGLRFTNLTPEARDQIRAWISDPGVMDDEPSGSTLGAAFLRALPAFSTRLRTFNMDAHASAARLNPRVRLRLTGFSGGLVTGLLISLLAGTILLFVYGHREQFGESLIHLGQRLASSKPGVEHPGSQQTQAVGAAVAIQQPATIVPPPTSIKEVAHDANPQVTVRPTPSRLSSSTEAKTAPSPSHGGAAVEPEVTSRTISVAKEEPRHYAVAPVRVAVTQKPSAQPEPTPAGVTSTAASAASIFNADKIAPAPGSALLVRSQVAPSGLPSSTQMFFDLGKFKRQSFAEDLSQEVAHLGMHTSVVQKGHLWMSSYQVLVGPYETPIEEKKISGDLHTHGIAARPFERGSRGFGFHSQVTVGGDKLPTGDFTIGWESYLADAQVTFQQGHSTVATASGKWVNHAQKFSQNEYVYSTHDHQLMEIHFAGLDRALVFHD